MKREFAILTLEIMLNDDNTTPLKKYFIWKLLKEIKNE